MVLNASTDARNRTELGEVRFSGQKVQFFWMFLKPLTQLRLYLNKCFPLLNLHLRWWRPQMFNAFGTCICAIHKTWIELPFISKTIYYTDIITHCTGQRLRKTCFRLLYNSNTMIRLHWTNKYPWCLSNRRASLKERELRKQSFVRVGYSVSLVIYRVT